MKVKLGLLAAWLLPVMVFAQGQFDSSNYFGSIAIKLGSIINTLIPAFIGLIIIYFIWGLIKYVQGGDEEKMKEARGMMIHGIVAIFIAVSIWGLVGLLQDITKTQNRGDINPPTVPGLGTFR